ncbi:MAG: DUF2062 domain-containing protein [Phycisphaerae bacterium]|nr:DUF2062 domain-containing protein [Phycisphaerae bacterium]
MDPRRLLQRARISVNRRILHLDDSPHRIALGVALGLAVGWSPTLGLQFLAFWLLAAILRANKASGVLPMLILMNPLTTIPLYWMTWVVGRSMIRWSGGEPGVEWDEFCALVQASSWTSLSDALQPTFWTGVLKAAGALGTEIWLGSLAVGAVSGIAGYVVTYLLVERHRRRVRVSQVVRPARPEIDLSGFVTKPDPRTT